MSLEQKRFWYAKHRPELMSHLKNQESVVLWRDAHKASIELIEVFADYCKQTNSFNPKIATVLLGLARDKVFFGNEESSDGNEEVSHCTRFSSPPNKTEIIDISKQLGSPEMVTEFAEREGDDVMLQGVAR